MPHRAGARNELAPLATTAPVPAPPPAARSLDNNADSVSAGRVPPTRSERRRQAYALREVLWTYSDTPRVQKCGRCPIGGVGVELRRRAEGAYYAGVATCGAVWLCPVCAAKVAARRASEVLAALTPHLRAGGGGEFLTLTLPHYANTRLAQARCAVAAGWRRALQGRAWQRLAAALGVVGSIRALEVTHGRNGWHPHLHIVLLTARPLSDAQRAELRAHVHGQLSAVAVRAGLKPPAPDFCHAEAVRDERAAGMYATKLGAALELTGAVRKVGRREGRTPFQILADFADTGDADDLALWLEWERGIRGARHLTWSHGLKARFGIGEKSDDELAADDAGGATVALIPRPIWALVVRRRGMQCALLEAAERDESGAQVATLLAALPGRAPPYPDDAA